MGGVWNGVLFLLNVPRGIKRQFHQIHSIKISFKCHLRRKAVSTPSIIVDAVPSGNILEIQFLIVAGRRCQVYRWGFQKQWAGQLLPFGLNSTACSMRWRRRMVYHTFRMCRSLPHLRRVIKPMERFQTPTAASQCGVRKRKLITALAYFLADLKPLLWFARLCSHTWKRSQHSSASMLLLSRTWHPSCHRLCLLYPPVQDLTGREMVNWDAILSVGISEALNKDYFHV